MPTNTKTGIEMSVRDEYDLVILGGGAAAFAAITEASERGLTTAIVNTGLPLGGTCVNVGCVPSKHLLEVGKTAFEPPYNSFDAVEYGGGEPSLDWSTALDEKDKLVSQFRRENYVDVAEHFGTDVYGGYGRFAEDTIIEVVDGEDEGVRIAGEKVLVATGSSPWTLPLRGWMRSPTTLASRFSNAAISPRVSSCSAEGILRWSGARSSIMLALT